MAPKSQFLGRFTSFMRAYGANVGGFLFNTGGIIQLLAGAALSSPRDITAALLNFAAALILNFWGHKNGAVIIAAFLASLLTILTAWTGLMRGETAIIWGVVIHASAQIIVMFNVPLTRLFGNAKQPLLKQTVGEPRRLSGLTVFFLARLPLIYGNLLEDRWLPALIFAIWGCADLAFAASKPNLKPKRHRDP